MVISSLTRRVTDFAGLAPKWRCPTKISADKCSVIAAVKIRKHITFPLECVFLAEFDEISDGLTGNSHVVEQLSLVIGGLIGEIGTLILADLH